MALLKPSVGATPNDNEGRLGAGFDAIDRNTDAIANIAAGTGNLQQQIAANAAAAQANAAALAASAASLQQQIATNATIALAGDASLAAQIAVLGAAASNLQQQIASNAAIASSSSAALRALIDDLTDSLSALGLVVSTNAGTAQAALAQEVTNRIAALAGEVAARTAADTDLKARTESAIFAARPGDARAAFTFATTIGGLSGSGSGLPLLPATMITVGDAGAEARIIGSGLIGMRQARAVEPGRLYQPRVALQRRANPSDPSGDAIIFGVAWLDRGFALLPFQSAQTIVERFQALKTGDGRQERQTLFSRLPSPQAAFVAPKSARYAVAYVQCFGADGVTGIELLTIDDVSEGAILAPETASTVQQVAALVSENAGQRLDALESLIGSPQSVTFPTRSDAQAGTIPDSANVVELLGLTGAGDGGGALYARTSGPVPAGADSFTNSATGAVFVRIVPTAKLVASWLDSGFSYWASKLPTEPVPGRAYFSNGAIQIGV